MNVHKPAEMLQAEARLHNHLRSKLQELLGVDADDPYLADMLEGETTLDKAVERVLLEAAQRKAEGDGLKEVIAAMQERQKRHYAATEALRQAVVYAMEQAGETSIKTPAITVSIRDGKPKLEIPDMDAVPHEYCQQAIKWVPDRGAIEGEIRHGKIFNWATMSEPKPVLTARIK